MVIEDSIPSLTPDAGNGYRHWENKDHLKFAT